MESGEYLDHLIGTKLALSTPEYTKEELNREGLEIKTPQIMRVIVKWIESLNDVILNCDKKSDDYFSLEDYELKGAKLSNMSNEEYKIQKSREMKSKIIEEFSSYKKSLEQSKLLEVK